ncbi:NUDIX domain-containing protein [Sphingobium yanoikuyae]|uniref:NUDIX domain-containing protein n=1 Tax=Sphingobium yanoikuyae TaxID=13690 RepID=UPI0008468859|nr:NUDIX domain-containing protein [Sphingobium yanoikuyae]MDG2513365.1 NUDIX domain-containing protein [Sphingobium yanoikuyae]
MTEILSSRALYEGWLNLRLVRLRMDDGVECDRHVVEMRRAVAVLPYDPERRVALVVSMPRTPVMLAGLPDMLEAIAGILEDEPADCARREALEEAGVALDILEPVGQIWSIPSVVTEKIDYFLAPYYAGDRVADGGGLVEEQENILVHELPLADLWRRFETQQLQDGKLVILLLTLRARHPALFEPLSEN